METQHLDPIDQDAQFAENPFADLQMSEGISKRFILNSKDQNVTFVIELLVGLRI